MFAIAYTVIASMERNRDRSDWRITWPQCLSRAAETIIVPEGVLDGAKAGRKQDRCIAWVDRLL
jgi:hypothetical protein